MRRALSCLPLALLLIANVVPSKAQKSASGEVVLRVREGAPLELECVVPVAEAAKWRREGGELPAELSAGEEPASTPEGMLARLSAPHARAHMAGVYACAPGPSAQRVRVVVEPAARPARTGVETTAAPAASEAAEAARAGDKDAEAEAGPVVYYDLLRSVTLNCTLANTAKEAYVWSKNGTLIFKNDELAKRYKLSADGASLELPRALEDDWGNYTCAVGGGEQAWRLHARVYTRLASPNTNVVEGQKLRLVCKVIGRPAPPVEWRYNESMSEPGAALTPAAGALGAERVAVRDSEAGVVGGELLLDAARRSDAGSYVCAPLADPGALATAIPFGHTTLRVKDMYAALWPFLGICAEVLVLCAVILVYEKRRTKPELDDSDTDNHDTKKS